jgi:hypothetical protein
MDNRREILEQRIEELKKKRGVDWVSPYDPELGFVTEADEIRKIVLNAHKTGDTSELNKIHPDRDFVGLYPEEMKTYDKDGKIIDLKDLLKKDPFLAILLKDRKRLKEKLIEDEQQIEKLQKELNDLKEQLKKQ